MKALKVSELTVGCVYKCRLSGLHILVEKVITKWAETMQGKSPAAWEKGFMYFNPVTGSYNHMTPVDDQLIELE